MTRASEALAGHRQLAGLVARMLALARTAQWKLLPALDAECTSLVERLRGMQAPSLSREEQGAMAALMARLAVQQAELAQLVPPQFHALVARMVELEQPHARMRGRNPTHDPEKCPPGGARSPAGHHTH